MHKICKKLSQINLDLDGYSMSFAEFASFGMSSITPFELSSITPFVLSSITPFGLSSITTTFAMYSTTHHHITNSATKNTAEHWRN